MKKEVLEEKLKSGNIGYIMNYKKIYIDIFKLLTYEFEHFDFNKIGEYEYLNIIFDVLKNSTHSIDVQKEVYKEVELLRPKIKKLLKENKTEKNEYNENYQFLKRFISQLEILSLSLLYNYIDKYKGKKDQFFEFLIIDVKNKSMIKDIFNRFPHLFDFSNDNNRALLDKIIDKYLDALEDYSYDLRETKLENVIYYNYVLKKIFQNPHLKLDIDYKRKIIRKLQAKNKTNRFNQEKHSFYINDIVLEIKKEDLEMDEEYLSYKFDVPTSFNAAINLEIGRIENNIEKITSTSNKRIYTFDNDTTKEIDDGLSISYKDGLYELSVHIADPLYYIRKDSIVMDEMEKRNATLYLSDKLIPMIPSTLSQNYISLKEKNYVPVRTYSFKIDENNGDIVNYKYEKEIAYITKNSTYDNLNNIIENGTDDVEDLYVALHLERISKLLKKYRNPDELYLEVNNKNKNNDEAHKIIEIIMTFVNGYVAKYYSDRNMPFIYRNHVLSKESIKKIDSLTKILTSEDEEYIKTLNVLKGIYPKAISEIENKGHYGLKLEAYTHITSPIRRYEDVLANVMQDYLDRKNLSEIERLKEKMEMKCENINSKKGLTDSFQREYEKAKRKRMI